MSALTSILVIVAIVAGLILIACELYSLWLICAASDRQFNRRLARLRARNVAWNAWRGGKEKNR